MSKEKRILKDIAGLPLSKDARAAAEVLLETKDGSAALADALNAAIVEAAAKFKPLAPAAAAGTVKKDKKKKDKEKKAAGKDKKAKDKKDKKEKKPKDKKTKGKDGKAALAAKPAADGKLPKPAGATPAAPSA